MDEICPAAFPDRPTSTNDVKIKFLRLNRIFWDYEDVKYTGIFKLGSSIINEELPAFQIYRPYRHLWF